MKKKKPFKDEPYKIIVDCDCCETTGTIKTAEGNPVPCPYCKGAGKREKLVPHPSHKMTSERCEIRCPGSTPRFYGVRNCSVCDAEELSHPAGHFLGLLSYKCKG